VTSCLDAAIADARLRASTSSPIDLADVISASTAQLARTDEPAADAVAVSATCLFGQTARFADRGPASVRASGSCRDELAAATDCTYLSDETPGPPRGAGRDRAPPGRIPGDLGGVQRFTRLLIAGR
jgi:hypothetical protein